MIPVVHSGADLYERPDDWKVRFFRCERDLALSQEAGPVFSTLDNASIFTMLQR